MLGLAVNGNEAWKMIGRGVRAYREARGISQLALGTRCGLAQAAISRIETGTRDPRLSSLMKIANAMDLQITITPTRAWIQEVSANERGSTQTS